MDPRNPHSPASALLQGISEHEEDADGIEEPGKGFCSTGVRIQSFKALCTVA